MRHDASVRIVAGEVQKAVHLNNRAPLVCQALRSDKFLDENGLILEKSEGPRSGQSTTMAFTYRFRDESPTSGQRAEWSFLSLRGIAKDVFASLGGGESFIRKERDEFYGLPGETKREA